MGIRAKVEIGNKKFLPIHPQGYGSKAIATFINALSNYCHRFDIKDVSIEIIEWFSSLEANMMENLCVIESSTYGVWDYSEWEYERYVNEMRSSREQAQNLDSTKLDWLIELNGYEDYLHELENGESDILSKEKFIQACREIEQKWVETNALHGSVNDLIRTLEEIRPIEVWWYNETEVLPAFKSLSETLSVATDRGFQRVRIYLS